MHCKSTVYRIHQVQRKSIYTVTQLYTSIIWAAIRIVSEVGMLLLYSMCTVTYAEWKNTLQYMIQYMQSDFNGRLLMTDQLVNDY